MAWDLSTGLKNAILARSVSVNADLTAITISMGDGDGTVISGADTINDTGSGLAVFEKHSFVLIESGDANDGVLVKVLDSSATKLEVVAGSFTAVAAGSAITLLDTSGGSVADLFRNSQLDIYSGAKPANADATEGTGTLLLSLSLNGDTFVSGTAENGLNMAIVSNVLKRATDPVTAALEVWKDAGIATGTAVWGRWHQTTKVTGASTSAIRMDGSVSSSGSDINMLAGTSVVTGVNSEVSDVSFTMGSA